MEKRFEIMFRDDGIWQFCDDDEKAIGETLATDSDRAVAIVGASMVEARLKTAILARCTRNPNFEGQAFLDLESQVFSTSGTLGSFGAKIDMVSLLGFLSEAARRDLKIIQRIRNTFAHQLTVKDFLSESVKAQTSNFTMVDSHIKNFENIAGETIVYFGQNAIPKMRVRNYNEAKCQPKARYLLTIQLFLIAFATIELNHTTVPII